MKNHERLQQKNTINFLSVVDNHQEQDVFFKPVELIESTKKENIKFDENFCEDGFKIIESKKLKFADDYFKNEQINCFVNYKKYNRNKKHVRGKYYNVKIKYQRDKRIKKNNKIIERRPSTIKFIGEQDSKNHNVEIIKSILIANNEPIKPRPRKRQKGIVFVETTEFASLFSSVLEDVNLENF